MKAILVKWVDAVSCDDWEDKTEAKELAPHEICTLGFLLEETDDKILVALNWDKERDAVSQTIAIPKSWIVSRRFIRIKV